MDDTLPAAPAPAPASPSPLPELPERYVFRSVLGTGGTGLVLRVYDHALDRPLAMKLLRPELRGSDATRRRLAREARLTAGMLHPDVVTVLDAGELADGLPWYTMREVPGARTLGALLRATRAGEAPREDAVRAIARVARAVGYAHARGVVHRDLKPANVLVGELGEVLVIDWGVALARGAADPGDPAPGRVGTPPYMAPEQTGGDIAAQGPASDVYALGMLLADVYVDEAPPESLAELVARCRAPGPSARPADGTALATALVAWLGRSAARRRAEQAVARADALVSEIAATRRAARRARAEADVLRAALPRDAPDDARRQAWALEDDGAAREVEAELLDVRREQGLRLALEHDPDHEPAHARLAALYRARLVDAEERRSRGDAARWEALLRSHARGDAAAYLDARGRLSLVTDPPGARVALYAFRGDGRRVAAVRVGELGVTPLREVPLERGSWLLVLTAPGRAPVRYPVSLGRGDHWDGRDPDGAPRPVPLPHASRLGPDDRYVPGGWFYAGGDPLATDPLPGGRQWVDGFVIRRFPVTVAEYAAFLDARAAEGVDVTTLLPDEGSGQPAPRLVGRDGVHVPVAGASEPAWTPRRPVTLIPASVADAHAAWEAERSGLPWRLPLDLEREKAARGVDGRHFPWGDHFEPTWARCADTPPRPACADVDAHPEDESPYGVRGLAGNVRDWCADPYRLRPEGPPAPGLPRATRGGAWTSSPHLCRAATRFGTVPSRRLGAVGLRLARPLVEDDYRAG